MSREPSNRSRRRVDGIGPKNIAFLGATALVVAAMMLFSIRHAGSTVRIVALAMSGLFVVAGLVLVVASAVIGARRGEPAGVLWNIYMIGLILMAGMAILALAPDPLPFVSTIVAALMSLAITWGFYQNMSERAGPGRTREGHEAPPTDPEANPDPMQPRDEHGNGTHPVSDDRDKETL